MQCPICKAQDQVQKASTIVASGTSTSKTTGSAVTIGATSAFQLGAARTSINTKSTSSSVLAQKVAAPVNNNTRLNNACMVFCGVFIVGYILMLVIGISAKGSGPPIVGAIALACAVFSCLGNSPKIDGDAIKHKAALQIWNDLNYCHRCDVVFTSTGSHVRLDRINELLFPPAQTYKSISPQVNGIMALNETAETKLLMAATRGDINVLRHLLKNGADINTRDRDGATALILATRDNYGNIVRALVNRGANVHLKAHNGDTALGVATKNSLSEIIQILQEGRTKGANSSTDRLEPVSQIRMGNDKLLSEDGRDGAKQKQLTDPGSLANEKKDEIMEAVFANTALMIAAEEGNLAEVRKLLKQGSDINETNCQQESALMLAAGAGHFAVISELLQNGAGTNVNDCDLFLNMSALHKAAEIGDVKIIHELLKHGANVNNAGKGLGQTALTFAVSNGHEAAVRELLNQGADVNAKEIGGITALMLAAIAGDVAITKLLLENGANPKAKGSDGLTAFNLAYKHDHGDVVDILKVAEGRI